MPGAKRAYKNFKEKHKSPCRLFKSLCSGFEISKTGTADTKKYQTFEQIQCIKLKKTFNRNLNIIFSLGSLIILRHKGLKRYTSFENIIKIRARYQTKGKL